MTTAAPPAPRKSLEPWLHDSVKFYDHQIDGIRWLLRKRSFLLADDMGLGKSLQALTIFCADVKEGKGEICFVVCTVSLRSNWADEIEKFTSIPYLLLGEEMNPVTGRMKTLTREQRSMQLLDFAVQKGPRILVMNYEQVKAHLQELNTMNAWTAIFDEAHTIKGHNSQRTKASLQLKAHRSFLLTGTPILNQVNELWPILNRIAPDHFPNYHAFVNRYCVFGGFKNKSIVGVKNQKQLHAILNEVMIRRLKKDVLDLPEVNYIQVNCDLSPLQQKLYDQVDDEMRLDNVDPNGEDHVIDNALTQFMRLKQICGTPAALGYEDSSFKLDAVLEKAVELTLSGEKIIVFTQFRPVLAAMAARFTKVGINFYEMHGDVDRHDRSQIVKKWSEDGLPSIILCMTQVAGVGLNMVAARNVFFIDKLFVPGLNKQAVDRAHRIGQQSTQPVNVYEFIARHTIEHRVEQILRSKVKLFDNVIEGASVMKQLLKELRS